MEPPKVGHVGGIEIPANTYPHVETISAFMVIDGQGNEGIASFHNEQLQVWVPLISQSQAQLESLRGIAQQIANNTGSTLTLASFSVRHDLEVVTPET